MAGQDPVAWRNQRILGLGQGPGSIGQRTAEELVEASKLGQRPIELGQIDAEAPGKAPVQRVA